jgi:Ca-activated chloride channel family protein
MFGYWPALLGLFVPLAILLWVWRRQGNRVVLPQDYAAPRRGRIPWFLINLMQSLPGMMLAVSFLLLASPRQLSPPEEKRVLTNIEFCLDLSSSMETTFGEGNRFDAAIKAINQFVDYRSGDAFGLTLFSNIALSWIPLTQDPSAFKCATPFIQPQTMQSMVGGGTMIGVGLRHCLKQLVEREEGDRMILLISDGESFDLDDGQDEIIAHELKDNGITLFSVHIGEGSSPDTVASIATITDGASFAAGDEAGLRRVFEKIDQMKSVRMEKKIADVHDHFWPYCLAGLSALGLFVLSSFGLRYTPW